MPRVADYSIVCDHWIQDANQDTISFVTPANVDAGSRTVLKFMMHSFANGENSVTMRLNGHKIWDWKFPDGDHFQAFQEVVEAGVLKGGKNILSIDSHAESHGGVAISDAVMWWQANI